MKTNVEPNWNNKSFHLELGESFLSIFFCLSQKVWCFFHQNRWCFTVWKLHIPLAPPDSTHAMGSFRELLQKLEDAHDQELSQLREVSCLCFFVVFVFVFCCCLCCYLWFCCFFLFLGRLFVGTLVFFFPWVWCFVYFRAESLGPFQLPSVAFVQKPLRSCAILDGPAANKRWQSIRLICLMTVWKRCRARIPYFFDLDFYWYATWSLIIMNHHPRPRRKAVKSKFTPLFLTECSFSFWVLTHGRHWKKWMLLQPKVHLLAAIFRSPPWKFSVRDGGGKGKIYTNTFLSVRFHWVSKLQVVSDW